MSALEQLALAGQALRHTLRRLAEARLWVPWAILGALQLAALAALTGFAHPAVSWVMAPLVRAGAGEPALHYPGLFAALPELYGRATLLLAVVPGAVAAGWSTWLFAARWRRQDFAPAEGWAEAGPRALALVLAQLPFPLLALGATALLARAAQDAPGPVVLLARAAAVAAAVGLQALALFVPALVVLERRGPWGAWAALPRTWSRALWAALPLAAAAALARLPFASLHRGGMPPPAVPETTGWLLGLEAVSGLVVAFLLAGSATLVYLGAVAGGEEER